MPFNHKQVGFDAGTGVDLVDGDTLTGMNLFWCALTGLGVTAALVMITEYYTSTSFRPVRSIAASSQTGHGTNVIQGLAVSLESTALPVVVICIGIYPFPPFFCCCTIQAEYISHCRKFCYSRKSITFS